MTIFQTHNLESAPAASRELLEKVKAKFGFIPNMLAAMAESPATLKGYLTLSGILDESTFSPAERQILLLTTARENGCAYCVAAHTMGAMKAQVTKDAIEAIRAGKPIPDSRLETLHRFCTAMVEKRGWVSGPEIEAFLAAGFTRAQVFEVILAVSVKTISNYMNHVAATPLDAPFKSAEWHAKARVA